MAIEAIGQIPLDLLESSIRRYLNIKEIRITDLYTKELNTDGLAGNRFYAVNASCHNGEKKVDVAFVVKRCNPDCWTSVFSGARSSRESLAWEHGLISAEHLPTGLKTPYVETRRDKKGAWVVMENISAEFAAFGAVLGENDASSLVLDRLASLHMFWEQPDRLAMLERFPWLYGQESRLRVNTAGCRVWLRKDPEDEAFIENWRRIGTTTIPGVKNRVRADILRFYQIVPVQDREIWGHFLCDRSALVEAFADLPQVLLHGDMNERNVGLRRTEDGIEVSLVDWEWIGKGTPALDVTSFLINTYLLPVIKGRSPTNNLEAEYRKDAEDVSVLQDYYFSRYAAYGGTGLDRHSWERACTLSHICYGLTYYPFRAGNALLEHPELSKRISDHVRSLTDMMRETLVRDR